MTHISTDLEQFVDQEVASGRFADRDAVIEHALRLFQRDREEAILGIKAGLEDVAAGRTQPLDEAFDQIGSSAEPGSGSVRLHLRNQLPDQRNQRTHVTVEVTGRLTAPVGDLPTVGDKL